MNSKGVTIISIVGEKNSGKTTLIKEIIPKLKEHGHSVGTLKYKIRKFDIDHKGKDTYKYYHSGADAVALSSQDEIAVIKKTKKPPQLEEIIEKYFTGMNIVLVEGYRGDDYPEIKIIASHEAGPDERNSKNGPNKGLVIINERSENESISPKDIRKVLVYIEKIFLDKEYT